MVWRNDEKLNQAAEKEGIIVLYLACWVGRMRHPTLTVRGIEYSLGWEERK